MKTVKDKYLVVGADFAGYPLKEAVVAHLKAKGWKITDLGVVADSDPNDTENMFHRVGLRVGAQISEGLLGKLLPPDTIRISSVVPTCAVLLFRKYEWPIQTKKRGTSDIRSNVLWQVRLPHLPVPRRMNR